MIYVVVAFVVGCLGTASVWFWWGWHSNKTKARAIVEQELTKVFEQAKKDVAAVPDPERTLTQEEQDAVLKRIHDLGDRPL